MLTRFVLWIFFTQFAFDFRLRFINCKDSAHLNSSLSILICLCENSYVVKKFLLSIYNDEDRKSLFMRTYQDQKLQVKAVRDKN